MNPKASGNRFPFIRESHESHRHNHQPHAPKSRPDLVFVQADKVVHEKPITMGTGQWESDRVKSTLEWRTPRQLWLLKIVGSRAEGMLKLADGTVVRRLALEKDQ